MNVDLAPAFPKGACHVGLPRPGADILEGWGNNTPGTLADGRAVANSIPRKQIQSKETIRHIIDPMV